MSWVVYGIQSSRVLDFFQAIEIRAEDLATQHQVGELPLAGDGDKPGRLQFLKVMRQRGCRYRLAFAKIGAGERASLFADLFENLVTPRIGQRFCDAPKLLFRK